MSSSHMISIIFYLRHCRELVISALNSSLAGKLVPSWIAGTFGLAMISSLHHVPLSLKRAESQILA